MNAQVLHTATSVAQRADRALFRWLVPYAVSDIIIEHIVSWMPGDESAYAEAVVIGRRDGLPDDRSIYSVHNLVWRQNDQAQPFMLYRGTYDIETFDAAIAIAAAR